MSCLTLPARARHEPTRALARPGRVSVLFSRRNASLFAAPAIVGTDWPQRYMTSARQDLHAHTAPFAMKISVIARGRRKRPPATGRRVLFVWITDRTRFFAHIDLAVNILTKSGGHLIQVAALAFRRVP